MVYFAHKNNEENVCKSVLDAANAIEVLVKGSGVRKADTPHFLIALSVSFVSKTLVSQSCSEYWRIKLESKDQLIFGHHGVRAFPFSAGL